MLTAAVGNWVFITEDRSLYLRLFDLECKEEIEKKSRTTALRTKLSRPGAEVQKPGPSEICNCSPCPGPEKEQVQLSSLHLLASIFPLLTFDFPLMCEEHSSPCSRWVSQEWRMQRGSCTHRIQGNDEQ